MMAAYLFFQQTLYDQSNYSTIILCQRSTKHAIEGLGVKDNLSKEGFL